MSTQNDTITQALGLEPIEGQDIYFQKVAKDCTQASTTINQEGGVAALLVNVGERAKFFHFLDESSLSDYEKDLLFRGFCIGTATGKSQVLSALADFMPPGIMKMLVSSITKDSE